jgi:hypothetical protein
MAGKAVVNLTTGLEDPSGSRSRSWSPSARLSRAARR